MQRLIIASLAATVLGACTLMPHYERPQSPVPDNWPADAAGAGLGPRPASQGRRPAAPWGRRSPARRCDASFSVS